MVVCNRIERQRGMEWNWEVNFSFLISLHNTMTHNILDVPIIMWSCNVFLYKLVIHFEFERTQDCTTWIFLYEIFEEVVWTYCGHTHDIHT